LYMYVYVQYHIPEKGGESFDDDTINTEKKRRLVRKKIANSLQVSGWEGGLIQHIE